MSKKGKAVRRSKEKPEKLGRVRGYIEKVIFPSWGKESKNGFTILSIGGAVGNDIDGKSRIVAKGTMPHPREGDDISFTGYWVTDPQYGQQFVFTEFEIVLPVTRQGVVAYLSSDQFYGIGPAAAEKIVDALGDHCLERLKDNPELAHKVTGLSDKQKTELAQKMAEHSALGDLIATICRHGIGTSTAGKIYAYYGARALDIVKENPYQLIKDVDGIGFDRADKIGAAVGIAKDSKFRIEAAIRHVLEEAKMEGHVAMRSVEVTDAALKLLGDGSGVTIGDVVKMGRGLVEAGELVMEKNKERKIDLIYLPEMYGAEIGLARRLRGMVGQVDGVGGDVVNDLVHQLETQMGSEGNEGGECSYNGFKLAPEQFQAVVTALQSKVSVITGGPGTGKSTITKLIVAGYQSLNPEGEVYLVAPTGRAAKRLAEATGYYAATIHRMLSYHPEFGFQVNKDNPLRGPGVLIVDEASMADIELAHALVSAIPDDVQVVFIGDVDQLPSVGPGAVLRDMIFSNVLPVTMLKYVYRQEEGSTIGLLADMIKRYDETKKMPKLREVEGACAGRDFRFIEVESAEEAQMAVKEIMMEKHRQGLGIMDFMVLTPLKSRGAASAEKLNEVIREIYNPSVVGVGEGKEGREKRYGNRVFRGGDKAMKVNRNDYKKMLFNGDIGVLRVGEGGKKIWFDMNGGGGGRVTEQSGQVVGSSFDMNGCGDGSGGNGGNSGGVPVELGAEDLANIELAYAFTVHKSQGGESLFVPVVCIRSHYIMLQRNLIYTAITRAKKKLVIVGNQKAFEIAVRNNAIIQRYGLLKERLQGMV